MSEKRMTKGQACRAPGRINRELSTKSLNTLSYRFMHHSHADIRRKIHIIDINASRGTRVGGGLQKREHLAEEMISIYDLRKQMLVLLIDSKVLYSTAWKGDNNDSVYLYYQNNYPQFFLK